MFDVPAFEQVIAVPKISLDRVPQCSALRRPQMAEQLVEVSTDPGCSLAVIAVRAMERRAALALAEQIVNNPAPQGRRGGGGGGGLQGLRAGQGSSSSGSAKEKWKSSMLRMWSRSLKFLLVEVSKVFSQVRVPHRADFFKMRMRDFKGFFALFTSPQQVRWLPASRVRECPPSELSAHQMAPAGESNELADERWRRGLRRRDGGG